MERVWLMQEYYAAYLRDIRHVSESSIAHYFEALKWISRFLQQKGQIQVSIFEVADLSILQYLRDVLYDDPEFRDLNSRGHQMYSAGMNNYMRFAEGAEFSTIKQSITVLDRPMPIPEIIRDERNTWKRSAIIKNQTLIAANFQCEIDSAHKTFIQNRTDHQYAEGHHIIALNKQNRIPSSLDVYANIICLCPMCHRFLHYGKPEDKQPVVRKLYYQRADRLAHSGVRLAEEEFEQLVL